MWEQFHRGFESHPLCFLIEHNQLYLPCRIALAGNFIYNPFMKKFLAVLILSLLICQTPALAQQILTESIQKITATIERPFSGQKGKNFFFCAENKPCSTEDCAREFYETNGYKVMRGEVTFWQGMFAIAFYDEIFSIYTDDYNDIPNDMFSENFYANRKNAIDKKYKLLKSVNLQDFINKQLEKYGTTNTRLLTDAPIEQSATCIEFFKTPIVQDFLKRIDNKTFAKIVYRIAKYPRENRAGTPDFVVWNDKELLLVEVKREKEKLRQGQIIWLEFLIKNKIPTKIIRVKGIKQ